MLTIDDLNLDQKLSAGVALSFSSDALPLFEAEFPDDLRPRKAIKSAFKWLQNPCKEVRAAYTAYAGAYAAARAATYADAYAAGSVAAHAAYAAAYAAADAAAHAANAAAAAANAVVDKEKYIHDRIVKLLPLILEYKIENKQSFNDAGKVFDNLSDEDKVSFLFNLDVLR